MKKFHHILGATNFEVQLRIFLKSQQGQDVVLQYTWE